MYSTARLLFSFLKNKIHWNTIYYGQAAAVFLLHKVSHSLYWFFYPMHRFLRSHCSVINSTSSGIHFWCIHCFAVVLWSLSVRFLYHHCLSTGYFILLFYFLDLYHAENLRMFNYKQNFFMSGKLLLLYKIIPYSLLICSYLLQAATYPSCFP